MTFIEGIVKAFPKCNAGTIMGISCPFDFYGHDIPNADEIADYCNGFDRDCEECWKMEMEE